MRILPLLGALTLSSSFGVSSADAQDSVAARDTHHVDLRPKLRGASRKELFFAGAGGSTVFAFDGALNATLIFWAVCPSRHRDDPPSSYFLGLGPCSFPSTETVAGTWLAGAFVGASGSAATVAMWRGCRMRTAVLRSVAGAAIGNLPGVFCPRGLATLGPLSGITQSVDHAHTAPCRPGLLPCGDGLSRTLITQSFIATRDETMTHRGG